MRLRASLSLVAIAASLASVASANALDIVVINVKTDKKDCGGYNCQWKFELDAGAPCNGFIVQQIDVYEDIRACDKDPPTKLPATPVNTYWESWAVKKGARRSWDTARDGYTDGSMRPSQDSRCGMSAAVGTIKFFCKVTTGDLGDVNTPSTDPNSKWAPGKAPTSGALPSTTDKPTWWDNAPTAGPATRKASMDWCCCTDRPKKNVLKCEP
jgi:hypothetical protein